MYAVIKTGGKQYRVAPGDLIRIEKLSAGEGDTVAFDQVLLLADGEQVQVGTPFVAGAKVTATVTANGKDKKVDIIKFKRRKHYMRHRGHRQPYTQVKITGIQPA